MRDVTWKEFKRRVEEQLALTGATEEILVRYIDWSNNAPAVRVTHDLQRADIYIEEDW